MALCVIVCACENVDHAGEQEAVEGKVHLTLEDVAKIVSELPYDIEQVREVNDAVCSSSLNGYDDEYTMTDLFRAPGSGVGDSPQSKVSTEKKYYPRPMKDLFRDYFSSAVTKSATAPREFTVEDYIAALSSSDIQIYWPYCELWDGKSLPIITFDPGDNSSVNYGYKLVISDDGSRHIEEVVVNEDMAVNTPIWVINRNDDSEYTSLEMLRRADPSWGEPGGGEVIVGKKTSNRLGAANGEVTKGNNSPEATKASGFKTLVLKDFTMHRNYDCWFAGGSEFFVKCGSLENFTASTEAELALYNPEVTEFLVVVKRSQVGKTIPFGAVLVSEWSDQLDNCAFLITEDDGGTITSWKCEAIVKIASKSYGVTITLPFNSRDDIVWRGQLSSSYLEKYSGKTGRFGDVSVTFELI